jgi:hypothetical protein
VPDVARTAVGPVVQLARAGDQAAADPGADLHEQQRHLVGGQRARLAEGPQVDVVLQDHRAAEGPAQARGDGVGVPARHDGRPDGHAPLRVDRTGDADHRGPHRVVPGNLRPQAHEVLLDGREHVLGPGGHVDLDTGVRAQPLAEVDDREVAAVRAEVGHQHVPAPGAEREPVRGAAASRGGARAVESEDAAEQQLVDAGADGGAGESGRLHEVGLAHRGSRRDEAGQGAERDRAVGPDRQRGRGQAQQGHRRRVQHRTVLAFRRTNDDSKHYSVLARHWSTALAFRHVTRTTRRRADAVER